jgi:hypothetical protein
VLQSRSEPYGEEKKYLAEVYMNTQQKTEKHVFRAWKLIKSNYTVTLRGHLWDEFCIECLHLLHLLHSHTQDGRQYSAIPDLHTLQFTVAHELRFSVFTSRIPATDLSQSHCNFISHVEFSCHSLIPFLPLFCNCHFRKLDSIQFLTSRLSGVPKLDYSASSRLLCLFITPRHGPRRKHNLCC